jgi:DNA-directed RNA polymerase alpha subunit
MKYVFECNSEEEVIQLRDQLLKMFPLVNVDEPISEELTVRTQNVLAAEKIYTYRDLMKYTEDGLLKIPNMGRRGVSEIVNHMKDKGLKLKG